MKTEEKQLKTYEDIKKELTESGNKDNTKEKKEKDEVGKKHYIIPQSKRKLKLKQNKVITTPKKQNTHSFLSVDLFNSNYAFIAKKANILFPLNHLLFSKGREIGKTNQIPLTINERYYYQRYYLFSLYDQGIQMDSESWFSVTPEELSIYISKLCKNKTVLDAFCGCGGNTIQFSKQCSHVYAIDIDKAKINLCKANAKVYSCVDNITFINSDYLKYDPKDLFVDYVFLSPPWGGIDYIKDENYSLKKWITPDIHEITLQAIKCGRNLMFYLPRSTNIYEFLTILYKCKCNHNQDSHNKKEENDNNNNNNEDEEDDDSIFIDVRYLYSAKKIKAILVLYGEDFNTITVKDLREYLSKIYSDPSKLVLKQSITIAKNIGVSMFISKELIYRQKNPKCTLKQFNNYMKSYIRECNKKKTQMAHDTNTQEREQMIPLNKLLSLEEYTKLISNRL